eukprot:CAMPEP_0171322918 /NCGR_PEP_ID=MMETSP0816-20121228/115252_1 /TAXON_ID=420281 /ORGANISM="Proboscia inermis, Strain CCAP1064/1" /LENGTH=62 /DNA_ID=CAMNT_0011821499 /DNA_START=604 /DNA_END=792 /DNA_ORIENTATION=+
MKIANLSIYMRTLLSSSHHRPSFFFSASKSTTYKVKITTETETIGVIFTTFGWSHNHLSHRG